MPFLSRLPFSCAVVFATLLSLDACSGSTVALTPSASVAPSSFADKSQRSRESIVPSGSTLAIPSMPVITHVSETPLAADALADSVGINTHMPDLGGAPDFSTLVARMQALKVRHMRDGILDSDPPYNAAMNTMLDATGAKLDGITDCAGIEYYPQSPTSPGDIQQFDAAIGNRLEVVEGPNEVDIRGDVNWVPDTLSCLPLVRVAEPTLPFYAPSIADQNDDAPSLGNISALVDYGNMHRYFAGRNPGTAGWGGTNSCGVYGALPWAICETQINSGSKPIVITETGYDSQTEVDELTQAKYLSRELFVNLKAGISRSYIYDLKDYAGGFGGDGLVRIDDTVKPAFGAIASEIGLFSDPGTPAKPRALSYSITSQTGTIAHALFEKNDGSYVLALWNEVPSWNPDTHQEIVVAPQSVSIALVGAVMNPSAQALTDAGVLAPATLSKMLDGFTATIDDHMTFVSFRSL